MKIDNIQEYEPYGKEWDEEISKLPKADLIKMIRQDGLERSNSMNREEMCLAMADEILKLVDPPMEQQNEDV